MVNYTYSKLPTINFNTTPASIARSATGSVYAVGDTTYTTPLNMTLVVGGSVVTSISSDANGLLPDFTLLDRTSCVWKQTGVSFATVLTTSDPVPGPAGATGGTGATGAQGVPGDVSTWKPTTFYPLNTPVTNPSGDLVKVTTAHTSTGSYDAAKFEATGAAATKLTGVVPDANLRPDLTVAALSATYVPRWKPTTAYLAGDKVLSPGGDVVSAKVGFTSGASYDANNWDLSASYVGKTDIPKPTPKQATKALATTTGKQHLRKLALGDSIANFKWRFMFDPLRRAWGGADPGASIGAGESGTGWYLPGITNNATTGTIVDATADFDAWFSGVIARYATGATRTYGIAGASATWDSAKVYYVKGNTANDGGTFKVQVDNVDETGMTSVTTTNGSIDLGILTLTRGSAAARALKVVNLTGAVRIIGVAFFDSTRGGVINGTVSQGGIPLDSAVGTLGARTTLAAYLVDYQPDIITLEVKEDSSYYATALTTLLDLIKAAVPTANFIGVGSTPTVSTDADQRIQNTQLKAACFSRGYTYWDGYTPVVDYATLNALGWAGDGIHVDDKANAYLSGLMLDDLRLLSHPALRATTRGVSAPKVMADTRIDLGGERVDGDPLKVFTFDASAGSGFDAKWIMRRTVDIVPSSGTFDNSSWRFYPSNSADQQIPFGTRVGSTGPWLQGYGNLLTIASARGGGTAVDLQAARVKVTSIELSPVTTANRPASAPDGTIVQDSTLGKPIIRNGGVWKELTMGATV